ncbi:putative entry exclusion protein TrbK-alt [Nguyenibacter vanlangensis]|uniref:Entry exclusion protein TrbK-alt n=1 Tax=Nguyenibacter vanlangensis TaxID=1216886 RepID=A0ABZ3D9J7_9PROT
MIVKIAVLTAFLAIVAPMIASAQSVDALLKDHALLNRELDRCKQIGMAANDDPRCHIAWDAENRRFFDNGTDHYTPSVSTNLFPSTPDHLVPAQKQQRGPHSQTGEPHG